MKNSLPEAKPYSIPPNLKELSPTTTKDETSHNQPHIRQLNDPFRQTFIGGRVVVTHGVSPLGESAVKEIMRKVANCSEFTEDNDPYDEHGFGVIIYDPQKLFWKIGCYDKSLEYGSPDPANPAVTTRVLSIMLASEY